MRRLIVLPAMLVAIAGCGGESARVAAPDESTPAGLDVTAKDGTTELRAGGHTQVLKGTFERARLAAGFAPDGRTPDGSREVLVDAANAATRTVSRFAVVDAALTQPAKVIALPGKYDYDAVSPDGSVLYLTSYISVEDPHKYVVRAYDVAAGALDPNVIADKSALEEGPMSGQPVARATTSTGAWVYTAYRGEHAFVHALDTVRRSAVCIDLPDGAARADDWELRLDERRNVLRATSRSTGTVAVIDLYDFSVHQAQTAA